MTGGGVFDELRVDALRHQLLVIRLRGRNGHDVVGAAVQEERGWVVRGQRQGMLQIGPRQVAYEPDSIARARNWPGYETAMRLVMYPPLEMPVA